jgi:protein-disulfide isomerase/rhodanese-related sulfurtransferase
MRKTLLLALSLLGLFDSLYLLWVYTSPSRPMVCLGSGCDEVRASAYAHLFGLPLPAFGVASYAILALLIFAEVLFSARLGRAIQYLVAGISCAGFLFSIYLTSLEAFVIHAWCAWCVVSALVVTGIFALSLLELRQPPPLTDPAAAMARIRTNFVVFVVGLLVGIPAFILLSRHGVLSPVVQASSQALAEHLVRPESHIAGNPQASLTLVEFGDFKCPACALSEEAARQVRAQYGDRIRFVFRQFPLIKIHPQAEKAAEASECEGEQGKFWEGVEKLYAEQRDLSPDALKRYAAELGLDQNRFNQCLDSGETASRINQDLADGHAVGVRATPTFFIGQNRIESPLDLATFSHLVEQELASRGAATGSTASSPPSAALQPSSQTPQSPALTPAGAKAQDANAESADLFGSNPGGSLSGFQTPLGACSEAEANKKQPALIGTAEVRRLLKVTSKPLFVDVRSAKDYAGGRMPGAINMPAENFGQDWNKLPKDKTIVLYESGRSSGDICAASRAAGRALLENGFSFDKVKVYQDGLAGWEKAGQPIQHH